MEINEKLNNMELNAVRAFRNYLMHNGRFPSVRELMKELEYKSPRSASEVIEKLLKKPSVKKTTHMDNIHAGNMREGNFIIRLPKEMDQLYQKQI